MIAANSTETRIIKCSCCGAEHQQYPRTIMFNNEPLKAPPEPRLNRHDRRAKDARIKKNIKSIVKTSRMTGLKYNNY